MTVLVQGDPQKAFFDSQKLPPRSVGSAFLSCCTSGNCNW